MNVSLSLRKLIAGFYRFVMPLITLALMLGVSSFIDRPQLFGTFSSDFVVRVLLCVWFCGIYICLSRFSQFSFYPNIQWSKADVGPTEKYLYAGMGILFGIGSAIITWWAVRTFMPVFSSYRAALALFNGAIIMAPVVTQY
jgi:hypothetical protein